MKKVTLKNKLNEYINTIKKEFRNAPFSFGIIALLGLTQLFFSYIPEGIFVNVSLLFLVIFFTTPFFKTLAQKKTNILYFVLSIIFILIYILFLFTNSKYIINLILSFLIFFSTSSVCLFVSVRKNYLKQFQGRVAHIFIALLFFGISYGLIYLIAFFIDKIFNLHLEYYQSTLYRVANSISTIIGAIVFVSYNEKTEYENGNFFNLLFGKILPILFIPVLSLAIIYFTKLIFITSDEKIYAATYYPLVIFFFLAMSQIYILKNDKLIKIINILAGIIPLLFIVLFIKFEIFKSGNFSIGFSSKDDTIVHECILNILISLYCFYLAMKNKKLGIEFSWLWIGIFCLLFLPAIGFFNFSKFHTKTAILEKVELTKYENFKEKYQRWTQRYEKRFDKDEHTSLFIYCPSPYYKKDGVNLLIDTKDYSLIALSVILNKEKSKVEINNFEFSCSKDLKMLIVKTPSKKTLTYDIFKKAQELDAENKSSEPWIYETEEFLFNISEYHYYSSYDLTEIEGNINFSIFFKK